MDEYVITCAACGERITPAGHGWTHVHTGDEVCGTGDGATAYPVQTRSGSVII